MALVGAPPAGEDNFDFIDRLLDTLQAENVPQSRVETGGQTPKEPTSPGPNVQSELDAMSVLELCEAANQPRARRASRGAPAAHETMNRLLSRFCEDGDESIVDELLDNFLGSTGDAGSLIEAIDQGMLRKQPCPPVKTDLSAPVKIGLAGMERLRLQDLESSCLNTWDALLLSARDLLLSARSPRTPHSARQASALPACAQDTTASARSGKPSLAGSSSSSVARPRDGHCSASSGSTEAGSSTDELGEKRSADLKDLNGTEIRSELLTRIAEMEDHEAMRSFMRHFLINMRRRLLNEAPFGMELFDDAGSADGESGATQDFDDRASNWSCRSVNTVLVED